MEERKAGCEHKAVDSGGSRTGAARTLQLHVDRLTIGSSVQEEIC